MPLPPAGTPNDVHLAEWAGRLGVRRVHSNAFWYASLPADARLVHTAGVAHAGRAIEEYVGPNSAQGLRRRAAYAEAVGRSGVLDAQMLSVAVLHRVPPSLMRAVHERLQARLRRAADSAASSSSRQLQK